MDFRLKAASLALAVAGVAASMPVEAAWQLSFPQTVDSGYVFALAIGDVNGDGRNDLVATVLYAGGPTNTEVRVYVQAPNGTLRAPIKVPFTGDARAGLALVDLDGDRRDEIVFAQGDAISIIDIDAPTGRNNGVRSRRFPVLAPATDAIHVVAADIDRDGHRDIVAQSWNSGATVYFGDGRGNISRRGHIATLADGQNDLEAGDFNGDGYDDVLVRSGQGANVGSIHYNNGQDTMVPAVPFNPRGLWFGALGGVGAGDFDGDGRTDVVAQHDDVSIGLWRQATDGTLDAPIYFPSDLDARAIVGTDIDADGDDDVVIGTIGPIVDNRFSGTIGVYLQDAGVLGEEQTFVLPETVWDVQGMAVGDLTGDHCPDVAAGYAHGLSLLTGLGCASTPGTVDLGVSVGATPSMIAIRLDAFGTRDVPAPKVELSLATSHGTLALGTLPAECTTVMAMAQRALVRCAGTTLAGHTSRTLLLPIQATGMDQRSELVATAKASTSATDANLANNAAQRRISLPKATATLAPVRAPTLRAPAKVRGLPTK